MSDEAMTAVHDVEADAARRRAILLMLSMRRFIVDYYGERGPGLLRLQSGGELLAL